MIRHISYQLAATALFIGLMALGANVEIDLGPVPFILSDYFVLLSGLMLGPLWAGIAVGTYLLLGALGLPVYAGGAAGAGHLVGPTGGFLLGFLVAAVLIGAISHAGERHWLRDAVATVNGQACIFILGVGWLKVFTGMPLGAALEAGFLPFLFPIVVKFSAAVGFAWLWRLLSRKYALQ